MQNTTVARHAINSVLDAELAPGGGAVDLAGLLARALVAGAVAVHGAAGDADAEQLAEELAGALPETGFDWAEAIEHGFPGNLGELEEALSDTIEWEDDLLEALVDELIGAPEVVGGVAPNPYSRMSCGFDVYAITWNGAVWFYERGDWDGMAQYWASFAFAVGDEDGMRAALIHIAEAWAGGLLCDHPDPVVRNASRRAYIAGCLEHPWTDDQSGWDDLMAASADELVESCGAEVAQAMGLTLAEAERLIRSVKTYGPGDDPEIDNTEAAIQLWWTTGNWSDWWG